MMMHIDPIEKHLLLEGIFLRYGYDFRQYAVSAFDRRIVDVYQRSKEPNLLSFLNRILQSPEYFKEVLPSFTINTTEFFRDPTFFKMLRTQVAPLLKTYPSINVWIAGCSTGEELVSLAILLDEEGLLSRSTIYATDINPEVLQSAKEGIYSLGTTQTFTKNYVLAGGTRSPSEYYTAEYGLARFDPKLRENVVFSEHNLATDGVFVEAHLILCRNVMIYFSRELQDRVYSLFAKSLAHRGFLGLGSKETLRFSKYSSHFESSVENPHLFQIRSNFGDFAAFDGGRGTESDS